MRTYKSRVYFVVAWIFLSMVNGQAQLLITKETKVLLVMDLDAKDFKAMELFNDQSNIETLSKEYPRHSLYIGLLQGEYKLVGNRIDPEKETLVTIFTNQQPYIRGAPFQQEDLRTGNEVTIDNSRAEVVSNEKGELILRIK